ncbi:Parathyroid hormone/parathyroid hormone- peptide receptor [Bulinus truncatus]|nr:Parathyroid hormone/parathyroid hormone- peptide receptor [Bulinus truncatus]
MGTYFEDKRRNINVGQSSTLSQLLSLQHETLMLTATITADIDRRSEFVGHFICNSHLDLPRLQTITADIDRRTLLQNLQKISPFCLLFVHLRPLAEKTRDTQYSGDNSPPSDRLDTFLLLHTAPHTNIPTHQHNHTPTYPHAITSLHRLDNKWCIGGCIGECIGGCIGECIVECIGGCISECIGDCIGGCIGGCIGECIDGCIGGCIGECIGECIVECIGECIVECIGECIGECIDECIGGCIGVLVSVLSSQEIVNISGDEQVARMNAAHVKCLTQIILLQNQTKNASYCPAVWDDLLCWPETPPDTVATQPCPDFINGFKPWENARRMCLKNGSWFFNDLINSTWTDLTLCTAKKQLDEPSHPLVSHVPHIRLMYSIGYGVSLGSLVLSIFIMISFKKLHCPRNTIHLNLFFSFILRASFSFMKENLLVGGLGFPSDVIRDQSDVLMFKNGTSHWECKLFFTFFHYTLGANYMWIFAEALYLHMIISVAVFSERGTTKYYILLGWASPALFVVPWIIVRSTLEDIYCWNTNPTAGYFWIMRGPIVLSIVVNFIFFLNILRVLFTKLNAVNSPEAKKFRYRKLAKSTLVLIPLFGVHYIVFAGIPTNVNHTAELIQLYFEMFFNSVQVQSEIKKKWQRFRITRLHHLPKGRSNSHNVTYATYLSRPRESNASVTQLPEQAGDGNYKGRNSILTYKDSAISLLPLKGGGGGNGKGRTVEAEQQSLMMRQMSATEYQGHYNGLT